MAQVHVPIFKLDMYIIRGTGLHRFQNINPTNVRIFVY